MKKIILLLTFYTLISNSFAQDNTERISEINNDIKIALENEDYYKAAGLKDKKNLLIEIDKAIAAKDFLKAAELQKKLNKGFKQENEINDDRLDFSKINDEFLFEINIGGGTIGSNRIGTLYSLGSAGAEFSYRKYYGKNTHYKSGLQLMIFNANIIFNPKIDYTYLSIAPFNIGFTNLFKFKKNLGLEFNLNMGYNIQLAISKTFSQSDPLQGFRLNPEIKMRYKCHAVGFDTNIINNIYAFRGVTTNKFYSYYSFTYGITF